MNLRSLGRSGIHVAPLGLGGNVFGWTIDEPGSFRVLDAFVDHGFNLIDTADVYSNWAPGNPGGISETIIGNWIKARRNRNRIVLTTKVGYAMGPGQEGLSRRHVTAAVEASLRRLSTDYIDLYLAHREDPQVPMDETLGIFADLVRDGKVRAIGACHHGPRQLGAAEQVARRHGWPRFETVQAHYNLYDREEHEADLAAYCSAHEIAVTSYFSLARGFLSGKYRARSDFRKSPVRGLFMKAYLNERGLRILDALDGIALAHGVAPASVAIAWLVSRPGLAAPIASATTPDQLAQIVAGARLQLLADELQRLDSASSYDCDVRDACASPGG
jgi:aryl-alcohol dehydrogenase-like predicted oxidoreductase